MPINHDYIFNFNFEACIFVDSKILLNLFLMFDQIEFLADTCGDFTKVIYNLINIDTYFVQENPSQLNLTLKKIECGRRPICVKLKTVLQFLDAQKEKLKNDKEKKIVKVHLVS